MTDGGSGLGLEWAGVDQEEAISRRDGDLVGKGCSRSEKQDRASEDRPDQSAFVGVESGGDKQPRLPDPNGEGKEDSGKKGDLEGLKERLGEREVVEVGLDVGSGGGFFERPHQEADDLFGVGEAKDRAKDHCKRGDQEAGTEFSEMLGKGHLVIFGMEWFGHEWILWLCVDFAGWLGRMGGRRFKGGRECGLGGSSGIGGIAATARWIAHDRFGFLGRLPRVKGLVDLVLEVAKRMLDIFEGALDLGFEFVFKAVEFFAFEFKVDRIFDFLGGSADFAHGFSHPSSKLG